MLIKNETNKEICILYLPIGSKKLVSVFIKSKQKKLIEDTNTLIINEIQEMKCFSVNSKDLFDKNKNPNLSLNPKEILKNPKIKKEMLQ